MGEEEKIVEEAKSNAIAALEEMKRQVDTDAERAAQADEPNAAWHLKDAEEKKAKIDVFCKSLSDVPWEDTNSLVMDIIVKTVLGISVTS